MSVIVEVKEAPIKRFNPYAEDLTADFFECINSIIDKYKGHSMNDVTRAAMERELWTLTSHLEMSGLMAPRMLVRTLYDGDHGAGRMTIELLDRELLPIRRTEPGYVPQIV